MLSLNVPVPGDVSRLASELHPYLTALDSVRERHTLVLKRLEDGTEADRASTVSRARRELANAPAFEARVTGIEQFAEPTAGVGPVIYLAVESPGLRQLHEDLVEVFGARDGVEGDVYTPHVTLGRGGPPEAVDRLLEQSIEPVTWTVSELWFYDGHYRERIGRVSLPG